jgi:hypothetical protein
MGELSSQERYVMQTIAADPRFSQPRFSEEEEEAKSSPRDLREELNTYIFKN